MVELRASNALLAVLLAWAVSAAEAAASTPPPHVPTPPHFRSATSLAKSIRAGEILPSELLEIYLDRVEELNPKINAIVTLDAANARKRAADADRALERGEVWGPLHGLPITVKEFFATETMPTTCGDKDFEDFATDYNAASVQRLIDGGAIVFGKTNGPFRGNDWQSYNDIYGTSKNPWDVGRTPGGSSGGSAAAIAAGLSALELGSDRGGSIRVPAHFTGTYGHKPTFGLISLEGHCPMWGSRSVTMTVAGPIARSADDLALVLAGTLESETLASLPEARANRLADYRVAVWPPEPTIDTDREVLAAIGRVVEKLRALGIEADEVRPGFAMEKTRRVFANLSIDIFGFEISPTYFKEQKEIRDSWDEFFQAYDVILAPAFGVAAFPHDHTDPREERRLLINGEKSLYEEQIRWPLIASVAELPVTVAPVGRTAGGMPIGAQIIGPRLGDWTTIDFARKLGDLIGGFQPPGGY